MHAANSLPARPLNKIPQDVLCPGSDALAKLQARYR